MEQLQLGSITVDVVKKKVKHVHLSVHPPTGRVRIAAPERMKTDVIRMYAISKLDWIKRHQRKVAAQDRETPREYLERESHYVWGRRYLLKVEKAPKAIAVELLHRSLVLKLPGDASIPRRQAALEKWYRQQTKDVAASMIEKWAGVMGVSVVKLRVQRMKTKWGSCNHRSGMIRLNSELAKKPPMCMEYVLVHELAHLIEPTHGKRFVKLMDETLPDWQRRRSMLNELPVRSEKWV